MTRKMKNSRLGWAGMIPKEWICNKAKFHVRINNGSDPKAEGDVPVYGSGNKSFRTCGEYKLGPAVLLGRKGSISNPRYIEGKFWNVDTAFDASVISNDLLPKYYYYLAQNFDYARYVTQTTLPSMTQTDYRNMKIPVPPVEEQQNIIAFIDKISTNIDATISLHQQIIEKLEEYRRSVITETLSGNNDEVRIHLQSIKVKYLISSIHSGDSLNADEIDNESAFPVYGGGKLLGRCKKYNVCDVIVIGRVGANCGCVINIHGKAWATDNALVVTTYNNQNYLSFLLGSTNLRSNDNATAQPLVTGTKIRNTRVMATTDPQEQQYIAQYLTRINEEVNQRISQHFQMIAKLQEYKQSLIYNAVTGKIDCRVTE